MSRKLSDATRAKISEALKGNANPKGCKRSAETRAKISMARKGRKHSAETRVKMSASHKGRKPKPPLA